MFDKKYNNSYTYLLKQYVYERKQKREMFLLTKKRILLKI